MKEIYHNLKNYMLTALLVLSSSACGSHGNEQSGTDNSDTPAPSKTSFTQGADISWVSEMEKKGLKFYNHEGIETDCFQLMKELGINAIRLRVWVNPKDRWNSKQDVVNKARRAKEQGLDVMVDFHYSDSWADPGQQFKPKAWIGKSVAELKTAIAAHVGDRLGLAPQAAAFGICEVVNENMANAARVHAVENRVLVLLHIFIVCK